MGYECPVCGVPEADQRHLADHLALTAATRGGDHEAWLDEHVPDWEEMGPDDLGPVAAEYATEAEDPRVFDDTTGGHGHQDHDHEVPGRLEDHLAATGRGRGDLTAEQRSIIAEARAMTAEMERTDETDDESEADDTNGEETDEKKDTGDDPAGDDDE